MAEPATVQAALRAYVADLCNQPNLALPPQTKLADLAEMDSLKWIETIAVLEERLGVAIDTQELENLATVADIIAMLARAQPAG